VEPADLLRAICDVAESAGLEIRELGSVATDATPLESGVVRLRNRVMIMLAPGDPIERRIDVVAAALREHAHRYLAERFIPPAIRERVSADSAPGR
jgi:hypothetical protein